MAGRIIQILVVVLLLTAIAHVCTGAEDAGGEAERESAVARGKQLVKEGNCGYCHTPLVETKEGPVPAPGRTLSGYPAGTELPELPDADMDSKEWLDFLGTLDNIIWAGPWGLSFAANITPDPGTGIGKWTEEIFVETMRSGKHIDLRRDIKPPMPWRDYARLSDADLEAIFAYLMTLDPVVNPVPRPIPFKNGGTKK